MLKPGLGPWCLPAIPNVGSTNITSIINSEKKRIAGSVTNCEVTAEGGT